MIEVRFVEDINFFEGKNIDKNEIFMGLLWVYWLFDVICVYNSKG